MKKITLLVIVSLFMVLSMSACYWNSQVESNEVGLALDDGVNVSNVYGPGRYTNGGWYAELHTIDTGIKTTTWEDPSLVTSDNQPIGLKLTISYRRNPVSETIKHMFINYKAEATNDERFEQLVTSRLPDVAKNATAQRTLNDMLKQRSQLADDISEEFEAELSEIDTVLVTVQVANISIDPAYEEKLKQKSQVILDRDIAAESVKTAEENLKKTKAETEIQLELARRQNLVNAEMAKTFELNENYFELERLKLLQQIIGANDKLIFIPSGSSLSIIESITGKDLVPVPAQ